MRLYRAVSQSELDDMVACGSYRPNPNGFRFCKWFALSFEAAAAWGRWFAKKDGLRYYIVEAEISEDKIVGLTTAANLDNIGDAICLQENQLALLVVSLAPPLLLVD